jgi:hypothetical protein
MSFSKKIISALSILVLTFSFIYLTSKSSTTNVYAANGSATITNNSVITNKVNLIDLTFPLSPISATFDTDVVSTFVCIGSQPMGVVNPGQSISFSGAAGTYPIIVVDAFWLEAANLDCAAINADLNIGYPVLSRGTFVLADDCSTAVQIKGNALPNGTFINDLPPTIVSNLPSIETPGLTGISVTELDTVGQTQPTLFMCINGQVYFEESGNYYLPAGTYNIARTDIPASNCGDNPTTQIVLPAGNIATVNVSLDLLNVVNEQYGVSGISTETAQPANCPVKISSSSSSSSSTQNKSNSSNNKMKLVRTGRGPTNYKLIFSDQIKRNKLNPTIDFELDSLFLAKKVINAVG